MTAIADSKQGGLERDNSLLDNLFLVSQNPQLIALTSGFPSLGAVSSRSFQDPFLKQNLQVQQICSTEVFDDVLLE